MVKVDDTDISVIDALRKNARASVQMISRETGLAKATIHRRIKKLEKAGIIEGYTVILNREKLGRNVTAYVLIRTAPAANYEDVLKEVKGRPEVEDIATLAGDFDALVKVSVKNMGELDKFVLKYIRKFPIVTHTQTLIAFQNTTKY